jgi:hypothetical protein
MVSRAFLSLHAIFFTKVEEKKYHLLILLVILAVDEMLQLSKVWQDVVLHSNKIFVATW